VQDLCPLGVPDMVFFGESLRREFPMGLRIAEEVDLVVVVQSWLSAYAFTVLPEGGKERPLRV